jgi:hypothetical protein
MVVSFRTGLPGISDLFEENKGFAVVGSKYELFACLQLTLDWSARRKGEAHTTTHVHALSVSPGLV